MATTPLSDVQATQSASIEQGYQNAVYDGTLTVTTSAGALTFPTDVETQRTIIRYLLAFTLSGFTATDVPLLDSSGVMQQLAYADLQSLWVDLVNADAAALTKEQTLLAQIAAATTVEEVQQINW